MYIGIDIGGTKIRIGAVDESFHLMGPCRVIPSAVLLEGDAAQVLADLIKDFIRDTEGGDAASDAIRVISVGVPGAARNDFQTIYQLPNTANGKLDGVNLGALLQERTGYPVVVNKDVNNLILHDVYALGLAGVVLGVYIGTGIGGAICQDGNVLFGDHGFAMDAGHIPLYGRQELCGCGKRGCAEAVASGHVLARIHKEQFPDTPFAELFTRHRDTETLIQFVKDCAQVPAILATVCDPNTIVLGGGVTCMQDFPRALFEEEILSLTGRAVASAKPAFAYAEASPEDGVIGAALFAESLINAKAKQRILPRDACAGVAAWRSI